MILTNLDHNEALRYMGYRGDVEKSFDNIMNQCERDILDVAVPLYTYRIFDIEFLNKKVIIPSENFCLEGKDIYNHLSGCTKAALFAATISADVEKVIRKYQVTDLIYALASDALASVAIEKVCDEASKEICRQMKGMYPTFRFSPGYGDLPISIQSKFVSILSAQKRIGLSVTESGILVPRKSVTAIIGFSKKPCDIVNRGCEMCRFRKTCTHDKCTFRL